MKQIHTLPTRHETKRIKLEMFALRAIKHTQGIDTLINKVKANNKPIPHLTDRYDLGGK